MAVTVELVADVSDVVRGAGNMAEKFEQVSDSLIDLARDADKSGDKIGASLKDAGKKSAGIESGLKDAGSAVDKFETKAKQAFKQLGDDSAAGAKKVAASQKDGFKDAESGLGDFKDEANSTAKESAASFDGSAESILGSFQEVAANAFSGFGPAGAVAGLAAAVGIGMAVTAMQKTAEEATAAKQKAVDMLDAYADAGGDIAKLDLAETIKSWGREVLEDNWVTVWADESSTKFQETAKDAKEYGISSRDAIRAAAGSAEDSQQFLDATADSWQQLTKEIEAGTTVTEQGLITQSEQAKAAQRQRDALSDLRGQAESNLKTHKNAKEIYELETEATEDATTAHEEKTKALEDEAKAMDEAAGAAMDSMSAELNYNDTVKQNTEDILKNGRATDTKSAAGIANNKTLLDSAKAALELEAAMIREGTATGTVTAKTQASRDAFIKQAVAAGYTDEAARKLATRYGLIPKNVDTKVKAHNVQQTKNELNGLGAPVSVPVQPVITQQAKYNYWSALADATRPTTQSVSLHLLKNLGSATP